MRVEYIVPSERDFDNFFVYHNNKIKGSGLEDIAIFTPNRLHSRGGGLFSLVGRVLRGTIPFLKNLIFPEIPNFVNNVVGDMQRGDIPVKNSLRRHGINSLKNVGTRLVKGGRKQKKKNNTRKCGNIKLKSKVIKKKKKERKSPVSDNVFKYLE